MKSKIKVGGRELALLFTVEAMDELEEILGVGIDLTNIHDTVIRGLGDRHTLVHVLYVLARQGEFAQGREPDFDETWIKRNLKPSRQVAVHVAVINAITEGLTMETVTDSEDEEVDVVLQEIKKKPVTK